jgi:dTDP-4-amino-4,6-dideoxygalactose transaminase
MTVPFLSLAPAQQRLKSAIASFFESFYDSGQFILGEQVRRFESEYAEFSQTRFCVGVGCGLDALYLALKTLGIGPGDRVIVPANTYIATWLAVTRVHATIVPVEPDPQSYNIDPERIEGAITDDTRAILPVHLFGQACAMDEIEAVARRYGLAIVEDNAQAHGARCGDRPTGSLGTVNATSFYPTKNLAALGDAGAVTTDDEDLAERVRTLRNYGSDEKNHSPELGINSRLDELQAGILRIKLAVLEEWNAERRRIASWYRERLQDVDELILPHTAPGVSHVSHLYVVRTRERERLRQHLADRGIGTLVHYPIPPHLQPAYRDLGFQEGDFPITEELASTSLSLPLFIGMTEEQVASVTDAVKDILMRGPRESG